MKLKSPKNRRRQRAERLAATVVEPKEIDVRAACKRVGVECPKQFPWERYEHFHNQDAAGTTVSTSGYNVEHVGDAAHRDVKLKPVKVRVPAHAKESMKDLDYNPGPAWLN